MDGTDGPDPPLYAALAVTHGINPRHELREDAMTYREQPTSQAETGYGADDDPQGPPSPPLDHERLAAGPERPVGAERPVGPEWSDETDPATGLAHDPALRRDPAMLRDPLLPELVVCPTCDTVVRRDRIRG